MLDDVPTCDSMGVPSADAPILNASRHPERIVGAAAVDDGHVDVAAVARPDAGLRPHAAGRTELLQHAIAAARALLVAAEIVAVEQVEVAHLAGLHEQVRVRGRAEARGQRDGRARAEVGVGLVEGVAVRTGEKKSVAASVPSAWTERRTIDSPSGAGRLRGPATGPGRLDQSLPVAKRICPSPSETSPPPDCQMPAPLPLPGPASRRPQRLHEAASSRCRRPSPCRAARRSARRTPRTRRRS